MHHNDSYFQTIGALSRGVPETSVLAALMRADDVRLVTYANTDLPGSQFVPTEPPRWSIDD